MAVFQCRHANIRVSPAWKATASIDSWTAASHRSNWPCRRTGKSGLQGREVGGCFEDAVAMLADVSLCQDHVWAAMPLGAAGGVEISEAGQSGDVVLGPGGEYEGAGWHEVGGEPAAAEDDVDQSSSGAAVPVGEGGWS